MIADEIPMSVEWREKTD